MSVDRPPGPFTHSNLEIQALGRYAQSAHKSQAWFCKQLLSIYRKSYPFEIEVEDGPLSRPRPAEVKVAFPGMKWAGVPRRADRTYVWLFRTEQDRQNFIDRFKVQGCA